MKRIYRFRPWLADNGIGITKGYQLVKEGKLKTVMLGRNRFVTHEAAEAFVESLKDAAEA